MSTTNISGDFQTGNVGGSDNLTPSANANPTPPATGSVASAGSTGESESDNVVAGLVKQYREAIAQGRAAFNNTGGYDYNQQFQVGLLNLFTNPAYQPYLALLGDAVVQELVGEAYEILVTSSLRLAYQFPAQFGLTQPQVQRRLAHLAEDDPYQTLARIRALIAAAFSDEGEAEKGAGRLNASSKSAGVEQDNSANATALIANPLKPARWTRAMVAAMVKEPVDSALYLGQHNSRKGYNRPPIALANDKLAVAIVRLLGRYGAMTSFQLRSWLVADYFFNSGPLPLSKAVPALAVLEGTPLEFDQQHSHSHSPSPEQEQEQEETPRLITGARTGTALGEDVPNTTTLRTRVIEALYHARYAGATAPTAGPVQGERGGVGQSDATATTNGRGKANLLPAPGRVIVSDRPVVNWSGAGRPTKMWGLEDGGKLWYSLLTGSSDVPGANSLSAGGESMMLLPHTYGVQQTLAAFRSVVNLNNRLGTLPRLLSQLNQGKNQNHLGAGTGIGATHWPSPNTPPAAGSAASHPTPAVTGSATMLASRRFRLEMEPWATSFPLSVARPGATITATQSRLIPDAVGRFVVDSAQLEEYLLEQANLDYKDDDEKYLEANKFWQPGGSDELVWPFFLEYDRGTETPSVFAEEKYRKYATLFNSIASSAWLPTWGTKFPVVLVVTEGNASDLYRLSRALISQVRANSHKKAFTFWWFTTTEWLSAAYRPYLDEKLYEEWERHLFPHRFRSGSKGRVAAFQPQLPALGHDARIWLPVGALADLTNIEEVAYYFKGSDPYAPRPDLMRKMSALPITHPLNTNENGNGVWSLAAN